MNKRATAGHVAVGLVALLLVFVALGLPSIKRAVNYEKVPALIEACNVGAVPHPRQAKWETQMPLKLLEYLAMGKMVVATDMGGP